MKRNLITLFLLLASMPFVFGQTQRQEYQYDHQKGDFFFYWGWNISRYSKSTIHFSGQDYNFSLHRVIGKDKPKAFNIDPYFHPRRFTVPQYNFRMGYFINDRYSLSLGVDHMKYVVQEDQVVSITGQISNSGTEYDGIYDGEGIAISEGFLEFEHTDGLNYINLEARRIDRLLSYKCLMFSLVQGVGGGVLYPRTNATVLDHDRYDQFHLAGYGISSMLGLKIGVGRHFFLQSEAKGGFLNLPDIRTTSVRSDRAAQSLWFGQFNLVFGAKWNLRPRR